MADLSLIDGAVPSVVLTAGVLALLALVVLPVRRRLVAVVAAVVVGALVFLGLATDGLGLLPEALPGPVAAWLAVAAAAPVLVIGGLLGTSTGRRLLALTCGLVLLIAAGAQVNQYFAYYPTVGALTGRAAEVGPLRGVAHQPSVAMPTPVVERWTGPATGTSQVVTASIPGTVSGLAARNAYVYLPAAYTSPAPPLLPVLVLVSGQPGAPQDWVTAGDLQGRLDRFAALHGGLAPVTVVVDPNGPDDTITMCMDSAIARADTYLTQDVPTWIVTELGVDANHAHWAFGGFSYGGTCAIQMATRHPDLYPSFLDISGEREPAVSADRARTVQEAFGGDTAAFDALTPLTLLGRNRYPQVRGYFSAGADDTEFGPQVREVAAAAQKAGMSVRIEAVPGEGHSWAVPSAALLPGLDWLAPRLGLVRG